VLYNYLSNALKFTPEGGRVAVRARSAGGAVRIDVSDTGIGIPVDEVGRIAERFFRASSATERQIPGTGLGLAISKAIVDAHGGSVEVESQVGVGTTFRVDLPLAAAAVLAA
jgi:signal transduction histidine kinase